MMNTYLEWKFWSEVIGTCLSGGVLIGIFVYYMIQAYAERNEK